MAFQTQEEVVSWYKQYDRAGSTNKSDEEIYGMAADWVRSYHNKELRPYQAPKQVNRVNNVPIRPTTDADKSTLSKVDTSPEGWEKVTNQAGNIALAGVPQLFAEKGLDLPGEMFDMSPEFFQHSYVNSLAGSLYQGWYGESAYNIDDYKPDLKAEIGSFVLGMMNVPELVALTTGSYVGTTLAKGATSLLSKFGMAGMKVSSARKVADRAFLANMVEHGIETGVTLGTLGASHNAAAQFKKDTMSEIDQDPNSPTFGKGVGKFNPHSVFKAGAEGFLESSVLGVPMGIGKGFLTAKYGMAKLAAGDKTLALSTRLLTGMPAQVSSEILSFSALPNLYKGLGWDRFEDYPDLGSPEWMKQLYMNTAVVGAMSGFTRTMRKMKGIDDSHSWANQMLRQASKDIAQIKSSTDNVAKTLKESGIDIDPELMKFVNENTTKLIVSESEVENFIRTKEEIYEVLKKPSSEWTKDDYAKIEKDGLNVVLTELGLWAELRENPESFRKILETEAGRKITDIEFETYKKSLENNINDYSDRFNDIQKAIAGDHTQKPLSSDEVRFSRTAQKLDPIYGVPTGKDITEYKTVKIGSDEHNRLINDKEWKELDRAGQSKADDVPIVGEDPSTPYESTILRELQKSIADIKAEIRAWSGADSIEEAQTQAQRIQETEKSDLESNEKSSKKFLDDMVKEGSDTPLIENQKTVAALVDWLRIGSKTAAEAKAIAKFLDFIGIDNIQKINQDHLKTYLNHLWKTKSHSTIKKALKDITNFFKYADAQKFIPKMPWAKEVATPEWAKLTKAERERSEEIKLVAAEIIQTFGGTKKTNEAVIDTLVKNNGNSKEQAYLMAHMLDGFGIRTQEVNKLTAESIKKDPHSDTGYIFNLNKTIAKGGNARNVPISERLYNLLQDIIAKNNLKGKDKIFGDDVSSSKIAKAVLSKTGIGKQLKEVSEQVGVKDVHEQLDLFARKYTESYLLDAGFTSVATKDLIKSLMGHDINWTDTVYGKLATAEQKSASIQAVRDWIDGKITAKETEARLKDIEQGKFQYVATGTPENVREFTTWLDRQIKKNPGLTIRKLQDAKYTGRFASGVIDVVMGKANKLTFFHENSHRLKAMIDATGNKSLKAIWKQAEKIFKKEMTPEIEKRYSKYKKEDRLEEFISDELAKYALGRTKNKTMMSKMKSWVSRLWSNIKQVIFGKERLTKKDLQNILGEKVYKGFSTKNARIGDIIKYELGDARRLSKRVKEDFDSWAKNEAGIDLRSADKDALVKYIAAKAGIENPAEFKITGKDISVDDLLSFASVMETIPYGKIKGIKDVAEKLRIKSEIDKVIKRVMSPEQIENALKALGVPDGSMWTATNKQLKQLQEIVYSAEFKDDIDRVGWLKAGAEKGELAKQMEKMDNILGEIAEKGLPVSIVIEKLGLHELSNKMNSHIDVELHHIGKFITFETKAAEIMGKGNWEGRIGKGAKDSLYLMDVVRYVEKLNTGTLKRRESNFISKAFKSDWVIKEGDTYVPNVGKNRKYKNIRETINTSTKEGKVVQEWVKYTDAIHESFKVAVKSNLSETEWAHFKKENNIDWIKDGIYVSRILTSEFKRKFNINGRNIEKLVASQATPLARKLAKEKYGTENPTAEQIGEQIANAEKYVYANLSDMFNFHKGRYSNRFLKKRHEKLPEFIEIDGKKVQVYETKYENTMKSYAMGMAKFLANTEIFPEYVKLKGFDFPGVRETLGKIEGANPKWGVWVKNQVEKQLGYGKMHTDYGDFLTRGMSYTAQVLAKTQLSFPTSGLKNVLLGQAATLQAFRITDYFRALARTMSKEFRDEVKAMGATEIGLRHIQDLKMSKIWDKLFFFGAMKPTENFNRYMSVAASKVQQERLARRISNPLTSKRKTKKALNRLKKFYKLSDSEIDLLKKYGVGGIEGQTFKSSYQKGQVKRDLERVYQKMDTNAHINTQGASLNYFMPAWAEGQYLRPLTLFKRMAYASTTNTLRNLKIAWDNGSYPRILMTAVGPILTGQALISFYELVLGVEPPGENSDWGKYMKHLIIRGEGLGILSDLLRMYEGESAEFTIHPAVYSFADAAVFGSMIPLMKGQKTLGQSGHDFASQTFGAYRGGLKLKEKYWKDDNELSKGMSKYRNLYYDFWEEMYPDKEESYLGERTLTRRSPYYRDFKEKFYTGTNDEFAKSAVAMIYAIATDMWHSSVDANGDQTKYANPGEALKASMAVFKRKIKTLNPNPGTFLRGNKADAMAFNKWLQKDKQRGKVYKKELQSLENQYFYKLGQFYKLFGKYVADPEIEAELKKQFKNLRK